MKYSRFYLTDLQVHTPADRQHRYGEVGGQDPNPDFARQLIEAHLRAGVDVIAVSDHNRVDWYPYLRQFGDESGVYVFPALEFSVNRCHLLAIWERNEEGYQLANRFLHQLWRPTDDLFDHQGNPRPVSTGQVRDAAEKALEHNALVLAPHATQRDIGFLARGVCTNRADVIADDLLAGYDVWGNPNADVLSNPRSEFGNKRPSWFLSGDTRAFDEIGQRAIYLKLGAEPTLEGLRQAFLMPETRIRFPASHANRFGHLVYARFVHDPTPSWPRLQGIRIQGGFHNGLNIQFAPGLNAIIGGKGTGKSTLIEVLRYVLHQQPTRSEGADNRAANFKANSEATLSYHDGSYSYTAHRTGSSDPPSLFREGELLEVSVARRVPARIFGQRELQELADDPETRREFVSAEADREWGEARDAEQASLRDLEDVDEELEGLERSLEQLADDEAELRDLQDRLKTARDAGAPELLDELQRLGTAKEEIDRAVVWPGRVREQAATLTELLPTPSIPEEVDSKDYLEGILEELGAMINESEEKLRRQANEAERQLSGYKENWDDSYWTRRRDLESRLADAGVNRPEALSEMQERERLLRQQVEGIGEQRERCGELEGRRQELLGRLWEQRRAKSRANETAASRLSSRVGRRVRVRVDEFGDRGGFKQRLEGAVAGQGVRSAQLERLAQEYSPWAVADSIRKGTSEVVKLGCSDSTAAKLCSIAPREIRAIEESDTPDHIRVEVELGVEGSGRWSDVADVSPGQRATALLAVALAGGTEPLIIDQPEDDLDNRYIYEEVVQVLASTCEERQVIVATHNANIPVLGDAEYVLALDAEAESSEIIAEGGLEDPHVSESAREILEGGDEAFRARSLRYQPPEFRSS